jgi:hypothetical protein
MGQVNKMVDALSRRNEEEEPEITLSVISYPTLKWLTELKNNYLSDSQIQELLLKFREGDLLNTKNFP